MIGAESRWPDAVPRHSNASQFSQKRFNERFPAPTGDSFLSTAFIITPVSLAKGVSMNASLRRQAILSHLQRSL